MNWPWPLDAVQSWFENFWNWVSESANYAARWLWNQLVEKFTWIRSRVSEGLTAAQEYLWGRIQWLRDRVGEGWNYISQQLVERVGWLKDQVSGSITWLSKEVRKSYGSVSKFVSNSVTWLREEMRESIGSVSKFVSNSISWMRDEISGRFSTLWTAMKTEVNNVSASVSRGISGLWDSLTGLAEDLLKGMAESLGKGFQGLLDWVLKHLTWFNQMVIGAVNSVIAAVQGFIMDLGRRFMDGLTQVYTPGSPDKEVENTVRVMVQTLNKRVVEEIRKMYKSPPSPEDAIATAGSVATLLGTGILSVKVLAASADAAHPTKDIGFKDIAGSMIASTGANVAMSSILRAPVEIGLLTPLRYAYQEMFTPYLPSYSDMIRIFVREGYRPEYQTEIPDGMIPSFRKLGYSEYWAKALWGAHWVLPSVGLVSEMLHRGIEMPMSVPDYLRTADYHPDWREPLIKLSWDLPGRIDARWMAGWDVIDVDEYGDLLVKRGLDPEWRDRVTYATLRQQNASYINKCRDNAKNDFVKGYITEEQLRANLEALEFSPERIEWIVQDALHDREVAHKEKLLDIYQDGYVKDLITDEQLAAYAAEIIVDPEALKLYLDESYVRKYRKPKAS